MNIGIDPVASKNIETIAVLTQNQNIAQIRSILDSFKVEVILSPDSKDDPNSQLSCSTALNLLPRFLRNVRYVGDLSMLSRLAFPSHISKINLGTDDWNPSITIIFGNKAEKSTKNSLYVNSAGWSVYISNTPCSWNIRKPNHLSAIYAGALAVGEVFKHLMNNVKSNKITHFEYDLLTNGSATQHPVLEPNIPESIHFDDLTLIGCGAIGQAFIYSLKAATRLWGSITLIDPDKLDASNEQRYFGAFEELRGKQKAEMLSEWLKQINPGLKIVTAPLNYEMFAFSKNMQFGSEVIVAVDNIRTRLNVQAALPKILWNVWTDVENGMLRYGVGKHTLDNLYQCLACSYFPQGSQVSEMELNSIRTGLPVEEIRKKLMEEATVTQEDIIRISNSTGAPLDYLKPNLGKPFREILHGDCGVFRIPYVERAITPAPHMPVLAGVFLATQVILSHMKLPENAVTVESIADFDALGVPDKNCFMKKLREPRCFCSDPDYVNMYNSKWSKS